MLQSACAIKGALTCTSCHGMHEGDPRGQLRAAFAGPGGAADRMCTGCHKGLAAPAALAAHARHDPAGEGARCVGCHMPRIVYGVLDVHRSHRIEIPDAARARAAGRPDACGGCHLAGPGAPLESVFAGDPVTRAVSADAIGRAPLAAGGDTRARLGALLAVMADDRYPAVRHIAWRGLRRLPGPGGSPLAADYDPSGTSAARTAVVARVRVELGIRAAARDRGRARDRDLEIGE
jgi:predicted CXXCH cytochrome family protein